MSRNTVIKYCLLGAFALCASWARATDKLACIDPMIGTDGIGHTFPGATTPFGMVQVSPSNDFKSWNWCSGYHYSDTVIKGFAHTHISGAGLSGLGDILLMPTCGAVRLNPGTEANPDEGYRSRFSHRSERASAGYYTVELDDYDIRVELTATPRVGFHRYTFRRPGTGHVVVDPTHHLMEGVGETAVERLDARRVRGYKFVNNGVGGARKVFFVAEFSRPFDRVAEGPVGCVSFDRLAAGTQIEVKVALSFVDAEGAWGNMRAEAETLDFDGALAAARALWAERIARVDVEHPDKAVMRTFYTALYHALISPNLISDVDGRYALEGKIYCSEFDQYSTFSTWDTFRAQHPLLTLIAPAETATFVNSLSSRYGQAGVGLPVWECMGHDNVCMIGYNTVPVMADAILKEIPGIDVESAYRAMRAAAFACDKHSPTYDVNGMDEYLKWSYVSADVGCSVSKTVEYNYYDWTLAQVARKLGKSDDCALFERRATGYRNLFDPKSGYLCPRSGSGLMLFPDTTRWAPLIRHYVSGNLWGYSTFVPHDMGNLIAMHGGTERFSRFLDKIFGAPIRMQGEQHVDISGFVGKYGHGDEPSHQMPYLYAYCGQPWKSEAILRSVMATMYDDTPNGLVNNDDLGQMSAWYVFSAMGFYPVCPGDLNYVFGTPLLERAVLTVGENRRFEVVCRNFGPENVFIQRVRLNGKPYSKSYITHRDLLRGGVLEFEMGPEPALRRGTDADDFPQPVPPVPAGAAPSGVCHMAFADRDQEESQLFDGQRTVRLHCLTPGAEIRYTTDGSEPAADSPCYDPAVGVVLTEYTRLRAVAFAAGMEPSRIYEREFFKTPIARCPEGFPSVRLAYPTVTYGAADGSELIDGRMGAVGYAKGGWSGFTGEYGSLDATVDMGCAMCLSELVVGYLVNTGVWIFPPKRVRLYVGMDPASLVKVVDTDDFCRPAENMVMLQRPAFAFAPVTFRYWRVVVENHGPIPAWHGGAGNIPYLFIDEVFVK